MGNIHINTDLLRQLGQRFLENCEYAQTRMVAELRAMTAQIEGDWQGVSRMHYDELFNHWVQSVNSLVTWGEDIGRHLSQTADQFDNVDRSA
ncbi:MAG TPA: WXG100 family type VII secretion target [Ktedonobacteraceae bacterium]|jgi:WXG100 family type VII secretion target|nr:WXG100 family type VII secretion target [Ktedonobacteraceae bacterium]